MNNRSELDIFVNILFAELQRLKSDRLKSLHLQDFNLDILRLDSKKSKINNKQTSAEINLQNLQNLVFGEKVNLSKWKLKRRAKKIYKIQQKIERGYISGVDKSISVVEKIYKSFWE